MSIVNILYILHLYVVSKLQDGTQEGTSKGSLTNTCYTIQIQYKYCRNNIHYTPALECLMEHTTQDQELGGIGKEELLFNRNKPLTGLG